MNAIDLLKEDHRVVDGLFQRIESAPPSEHPPIFKKIKDELDAHAHVEEKLFYPALKAKGDKALVDITAEGFEEHAQIKKFLQEIGGSGSTEKREAKLKVLIEDTRHHVKEEEGEMFDLVEDQFSSEELEALGDKMETEKKSFQAANKIPPRREEPKGAIAAVLDKAKELVNSLAGGPSEEKRSPRGSKPAAKSKTSGSSSTAKAKAQSGSSSKKTSAGRKQASSGSRSSSNNGAKMASAKSASGAKKASGTAGSGAKKVSAGTNSGGKKTSGASAAGGKKVSGRTASSGKKASSGSSAASTGKKAGSSASGGKKGSTGSASGTAKKTSAAASGKGGSKAKKSTGGSKVSSTNKASGKSRSKSSAK